MKSDEIFIAIIWAVVSIAGLAIGGKVLDDFQRGKNFNKDLFLGSEE